MKLISIIIFSLVISACATKSPNDVVAVKAGDEYYQVDTAAAKALEGDNEERVMCTRRSVVGTNKKKKICTTQTEIDRERDNARDIMQEVNKIKAQEATVGKGG